MGAELASLVTILVREPGRVTAGGGEPLVQRGGTSSGRKPRPTHYPRSSSADSNSCREQTTAARGQPPGLQCSPAAAHPPPPPSPPHHPSPHHPPQPPQPVGRPALWPPHVPLAGGTLYRRHFTPSHMTPIVTGPQQYSHMPQGVPSHVLEADPSHSQPHSRLSRATTTQARRHPRRAAPIAADAPPLRCVRLSTGARRCLERSMSLARAATRSRRSDHP